MPLLDLPEEILFVVLEYAILPSSSRLSLPEPQYLLVCRTIHRIGVPILYRSILLRSNSQALKVESTILSRPELIHHIRHLYSSAPTSWLAVFRAIGDGKGSLQTLDFVIRGGSYLFSGEDASPSLSTIPVRRLVVRQGPAGLLQACAPIAASALARAIEGWTSLEVAVVEPRVLFFSSPQLDPSPLALALSRSPLLRVLRTPLPPAWVPSLLIASENPSLVRIELTKLGIPPNQDGLSGIDVDVSIPELLAQHDDHPWLVEAQKHPRLMGLIGANKGTARS